MCITKLSKVKYFGYRYNFSQLYLTAGETFAWQAHATDHKYEVSLQIEKTYSQLILLANLERKVEAISLFCTVIKLKFLWTFLFILMIHCDMTGFLKKNTWFESS